MTEITGPAPRASGAHGTSAGCDSPTRGVGRRRQLVVGPGVGLLHADRKRCGRLPAETFEDERVVRVAPANAFWRVEVVPALQPHPSDLLDRVDELVDADELGRAEVDRIEDVAPHDHRCSQEAVLDVHEAPRLLPVSPDLDLVAPGELCLGDLPADRGRRLLAPTGVRPVRPVDVVIPGYARLDSVVVVEVPAHALREELLPPV